MIKTKIEIIQVCLSVSYLYFIFFISLSLFVCVYIYVFICEWYHFQMLKDACIYAVTKWNFIFLATCLKFRNKNESLTLDVFFYLKNSRQLILHEYVKIED